jgi:hypothetical protein
VICFADRHTASVLFPYLCLCQPAYHMDQPWRHKP